MKIRLFLIAVVVFVFSLLSSQHVAAQALPYSFANTFYGTQPHPGYAGGCTYVTNWLYTGNHFQPSGQQRSDYDYGYCAPSSPAPTTDAPYAATYNGGGVIFLDPNATSIEISNLSQVAIKFSDSGFSGFNLFGASAQYGTSYPASTTATLKNAVTGEVYYTHTESGAPNFNYPGCGGTYLSCANYTAPQQIVLTNPPKTDMGSLALTYQVSAQGPWTSIPGGVVPQGDLIASHCPSNPILSLGKGTCPDFVVVDGLMYISIHKGPLTSPPPPPVPTETITLNAPQPNCSNSGPYVNLTWSSTVASLVRDESQPRSMLDRIAQLVFASANAVGPTTGPSYTVYRDGVAIGSTTDSDIQDSLPPPGNHQYMVTAISSTQGTIQSNQQSATLPAACPGSGISVQISGPTNLNKNSQYQYSAVVTDVATGQPISLNLSGSSGGPSSNISINFDDASQGRINGDRYVSNGRELLIESGINGTGPSNDIPGDGAYLFRSSSAACPGFGSLSNPNYLVANVVGASPASWAPLKLKFNGQKVVDSATFSLVLAGSEVVEVQTVDTNGTVINTRSFNGPGSGVCSGSSYAVGVSLNKGSTTGIAEIRLRRTDADIHDETRRTNGFGIDDLSYTQPHLATAADTLQWSLVNNRIGSLSPISSTPTALTTGSVCEQTDVVAIQVSVSRNGQVQMGSASLPIAVSDACPGSPAAPSLGVLRSCNNLNQLIDTLTWNNQPSVTSYNIYRDGAYLATQVPLPDSYVAFAPINTASSYTVKAFNLSGSSQLSQARVVVAASCSTPSGNPTVAIIKALSSNGQCTGVAQATLKRGQQYNYCVEASINGQAVPVVAPGSNLGGGSSPNGGTYAEVLSGSWLINAPTVGSLNTAANQLTTQLTTSQNNRAVGSVSVVLRVFINNVQQPNITARLPVFIDDPSFLMTLGDIFGRGNVKGLTVGKNAIVSSSGIITLEREGEGAQGLNIQGYNPQNRLSWGDFQAQSQSDSGLIQRLIHESSMPLNQIPRGSTFNLNPKNRSATAALDPHGAFDDANPEGGVWHVPGDLSLDNVTFRGRGTIIVDGIVVSTGFIHYQDDQRDMLGVISLDQSSRDKISFRPPVASSIRGSYFAPFAAASGGAISFGPNLTDALGLFVGDSIAIANDPSLASFTITYDGRITKNPLPGFRQSFVPSVNETTP